jgi:hypothetical protein
VFLLALPMRLSGSPEVGGFQFGTQRKWSVLYETCATRDAEDSFYEWFQVTLPTLALIVLLLPETVGMIAVASISAGALLRGLLTGGLVMSRLEFRLLIIAIWVAAGLLRFDWGASVGIMLYSVSALATMGLLLTWKTYRSSEFLSAIRVIQAVAILEALVVLYKWIQMDYPRPDDWASGITGSAHDAGMLFVFAMAVQAGHYLVSKRALHLFSGLFFTGMLYLTATHQALGATLMSTGLVLVLVRRRSFFLPLLATLLFIAVAPTFYTIGARIINRGTDIPKLLGYGRTIDMFVENPVATMTGVGAGNYGSRAAVARSDPDDLAKNLSRVPEYLVGTPSPLKQYLADLYSPEYYSKLGNWGTFYTPFSTWNAILGEQGLIGIMLFLLLWFKILHASFIVLRGQVTSSIAPAFVTAVVGIGLIVLFAYDNWLEYPKLMFPFFVSAAYTYKLYRAGENSPVSLVCG